MFAFKQVGESPIDGEESGVGQLHAYTAAVMGIGTSLHETAIDEPVDPVGHSAAGDQRLRGQLSGRKRVGLTCASQRGEDVEFPAIETVGIEGLRPGLIEVAGESGNPGEHLEGLHVQVRTLAAPGGDDRIDIVILHNGMLVKNLDVEILDRG
jgi:hypothetical protein